MNQTVAAMCRTFNVVVEDECHIKIVEGHVLNAWLVRHSAWVYSRYQRRESGQTAVQELKDVAYTSDLVPFGETVAAPQENGKRLASGHLGRTNEQLQRAHSAHPRRGTSLQVGSTACAGRTLRQENHGECEGPTLGSETTQRSRRRRTIRRTRTTTRNAGTVRRATGGPNTRSRTCTVPRVLWTNTRLPSMPGNTTRISPHGGLQSKTARVARPTRVRRNGNIRTGTIRTSARVSNNVGGPSESSHRDSWR